MPSKYDNWKLASPDDEPDARRAQAVRERVEHQIDNGDYDAELRAALEAAGAEGVAEICDVVRRWEGDHYMRQVLLATPPGCGWGRSTTPPEDWDVELQTALEAEGAKGVAEICDAIRQRQEDDYVCQVLLETPTGRAWFEALVDEEVRREPEPTMPWE